MTYTSILEMAASQSLQARVAACAADEGYIGDPVEWARQNIWAVVSSSDWISNWDSAKASQTVNDNPDTGARNDVVSDAMILSVVQPMVHPA
jgi:hypothetical protein